MMFLIKIRNVMIVTLVILGCSFMYMGMSGFADKYKLALDDSIIEELNETTQVVAKGNKEKDQIESKEKDQTPNKDQDKQKGGDGEKVIQDDQTTVKQSIIEKNSEFFVDFRIKREKDHASQIEVLREIVDNPNSSAEIRTKAQEELLVVSKDISLESKIENLFKAKEYKEAVAVVQNETATIIIKADTLKETDVSKLGDLVIKATGFTLDNISIIPKK
ncbi:stage III sporulation protein AH [Desulfonispora thiosulfatigenes DSM 11270]|uniref:Stage III sporulation protein AH n=1 Tax=Desulfonispora thiosulfatigenes DSM 11270 TaxID=656914 RepID=A0A1W1VNN8_DESTI|nr:SpoIIIAH-like family protein [Desulfonispora thiosulfatigenes]SMB94840.1 stage III sporulation protein AH [Desulfonispora thiosulfatigenes DSM 11270]